MTALIIESFCSVGVGPAGLGPNVVSVRQVRGQSVTGILLTRVTSVCIALMHLFECERPTHTQVPRKERTFNGHAEGIMI